MCIMHSLDGKDRTFFDPVSIGPAIFLLVRKVAFQGREDLDNRQGLCYTFID